MQDFEVCVANDNVILSLLEWLLPYESCCVSLVSHIIDCQNTSLEEKKDTVFYIVRKSDLSSSKHIFGVFLITNYGVVLHHLKRCPVEALLSPILRRYKLFSIAGTEEGSKIFEKALSQPSNLIYEYHLMLYSKAAAQKIGLDTEYILHECSLQDEKRLYQLQYNYQLEEVLPPGSTLSEKSCHYILINRLSKQKVFAIQDKKNKLVAMAGTNARGKNFVQLGGIYTDTKHRGKGLAQSLVQSLTESITRGVVLFVRTHNIPAIKAYTKCGFSTIENYKILYFR